MRGAKRAFLVIDILLSLIGSIALTVSSLGIVNTMVMSILERTREIGIMKAIGGGDGDIRRIFLIEASVIGLLGGMAGVVIGWVVGRAINFGANIYIKSQGGTPGDLFSMPLWLIAGAIGFSLLVSLIAGSYPARRAARLDPIQALQTRLVMANGSGNWPFNATATGYCESNTVTVCRAPKCPVTQCQLANRSAN